ncbi:hypothetical protein [Synechococcus sp. PCC 6312]|uniref:hypothetical protein n=1 Tax=Synechococcus sp. (strain ATCC 27167 / PCC 6312) TaxID=195253 RepID=UPI00029EEE58|nr:hypothetical protein [Synechococcus sp. PCC 6312]AFY59958.1 hypothetical protein Syn6312_0740 [Synechococcus sp. PCC 6312]
MVRLLQIIPDLPPSVNGLGDYALNLARPLYNDYNILTEFAVGNPSWKNADKPGYVENFKATPVQSRKADALVELIKGHEVIILHYVGYGYAKRGCPFWLVRGLEKWKKQENGKLITMFHELYASGSIQSSAFWLHNIQKNLCKSILSISQTSITSKSYYAELLHKLRNNRELQTLLLPVFSNVGEATHNKPLTERDRHLIIFGGRSKKYSIYTNFVNQLNSVCDNLNITKIIDIGEPISGVSYDNITVDVMCIGKQECNTICNYLTNSIAAFLSYPSNFLAKSTVFAAYCSHGVVPILATNHQQVEDNIEHGTHYLTPSSNFKNLHELQKISNQVFEWYQSHTLEKQTKVFSDIIRD